WFLQARHVRHRQAGDTIYPGQVHRMLTRVLYAGYLRCPTWGIPLTKAQHEPLISLDTFSRIQDRLAKKREVVHDRRDMKADFPLRGFVLCSGCHKPYTAAWNRGRKGMYPYYRCAHRGCPLRDKGIRKEVLEEQFEALLRTTKPAPEAMEVAR